MPARLRLPPFGKQLLMGRRQGKAVRSIHLIYDEDWADRGQRCDEACDGSHPRICMKPDEFEPFRFDWTLVTGCLVAVFDGTQAADGWAHRRNFYDLLGELGRFAGPVQCYWNSGLRWQFAWDAGGLAIDLHRTDGKWPRWWPPETEALNAPRRRTWWETYQDGRESAAAA